MRMFFKDDEIVTIAYGLESWEIKKQVVADYLVGKCKELEGTDDSCTLESVIMLGYLPFADRIVVSEAEENSIKIEHVVTKMEIDEHLKTFLISK